MKKLFFLTGMLLFFTTNFLYSQSDPLEILKNSYKYNSFDTLEIFLNKWETESQSIKSDDSLLQSENFNEINNILNAFIEFLLNEPQANSKYFIIQKTIFFEFDEMLFDTNSFAFYFYKDSIVDFHPTIELKNRKILYSSSIYFQTINYFLNPEMSDEEDTTQNKTLNYYNKKNWLDSFKLFHIFCGYSGYKCVIEPYPFIKNILINKDRDSATIYYRVNKSGGEAILKKVDNKWKLVLDNLYFNID